MYPDMLDQLMIAAEGFQALLTLVGLHLGPARQFSAHMHLHRRFVHEDLQQKEAKHCTFRYFQVLQCWCACVVLSELFWCTERENYL